MKTRQINQVVYYFSLLIWIANFVFFIIPLIFADVLNFCIAGVLITILILAYISGTCYDETLVPKSPVKYKLIDYCLLASKYISLGLTLVGFLSLLISGGGPEIIDNAYCIVNHGEIIRYVSEEWFLYFCLCQLFMFACGITYFSTYMMLRIRTLYIIQRMTADE